MTRVATWHSRITCHVSIGLMDAVHLVDSVLWERKKERIERKKNERRREEPPPSGTVI